MCLGSKIFILKMVRNISIASYLIFIRYLHFQGIFIEKKSNLYIKISLIEKKKELSSKKVWCSNNKTTIDFSKEVILNLHDRDPRNCSLLFQLKKYSGLGSRSGCNNVTMCNIFARHWHCKSASDEKLSQLVLGCEGEGGSHYSTMLDKPGDRIFVWHNADCFWSTNPHHTSLSELYSHIKLSLFIHS